MAFHALQSFSPVLVYGLQDQDTANRSSVKTNDDCCAVLLVTHWCVQYLTLHLGSKCSSKFQGIIFLLNLVGFYRLSKLVKYILYMSEALHPGSFCLLCPRTGGIGATLFGSLGVSFGRSGSGGRGTQQRIDSLIKYVSAMWTVVYGIWWLRRGLFGKRGRIA